MDCVTTKSVILKHGLEKHELGLTVEWVHLFNLISVFI